MRDRLAIINDRKAESLPLGLPALGIADLHLLEHWLVQEHSVRLMGPHDKTCLLLLGVVVANVEFEGSFTLLVPARLIIMVELGPWCYEDG